VTVIDDEDTDLSRGRGVGGQRFVATISRSSVAGGAPAGPRPSGGTYDDGTGYPAQNPFANDEPRRR
jgi:hypothetical protein